MSTSSSTLSSGSEKPPRKRSRKDSECSSRSQPDSRGSFSRDKQFWYDDGNIIVVAQDVGFRVYKGMLSRPSEVFRDMFSLAQPAPNQSREQTPEDCPIVHVTDTADEMRSLLMILLEGRQYMQRLDFEFDDMANCIRLAHKYRIEDLLEDSLKALKQYCPDDFDAWDTRAESSEPEHAIVAVNLMRLTGEVSLLPAAIYACSQLDARQLLDGYKRKDGVVDALSREDLELCIDGKAKLCIRTVPFIRNLFRSMENADCVVSGNLCQESITSLRFTGSAAAVSRGYDLLDSAKEDIWRYDRTKRPLAELVSPLCPSCITALCVRDKMQRRELVRTTGIARCWLGPGGTGGKWGHRGKLMLTSVVQ
ncbi:uncharacterized protein B0H18DRAFT_933899 [Fomitopsis serialis]|uniref:uncharacterized protein n=1 Tax=Fomitopsis serialis TaxID=139415 RepID=UPI002008E597|nr:uncharacterized protein B0H18DRAFT_933899 [Neoantrodia serialis]KAH9925146.1 hypothetical protein B0H18DRAFT_933899 [Neoantrodia serialis]